MKGTQRERTVRDVAARWLCESLRAREDVVAATYWFECRVKPSSKSGRGYADAVIAAMMQDGTIYTISLEAKSMRTFRALRGESGCVTHGLIAVPLGGIAAAAARSYVGGGWGVAAAIVAFFVAACLTFVALWRLRLFFTRASAIDQALRYPGDERWLAVPQDAVRWSGTAFADLRRDCSTAGVGLLGVSRRNSVCVHQSVAPSRKSGRALQEYVRGDDMLRELSIMSGQKARRQ